jgi:hypothetical protein
VPPALWPLLIGGAQSGARGERHHKGPLFTVTEVSSYVRLMPGGDLAMSIFGMVVRPETTIRKTFRPSTGGATGKRGRAGGNVRAFHYRSVNHSASRCLISFLATCSPLISGKHLPGITNDACSGPGPLHRYVASGPRLRLVGRDYGETKIAAHIRTESRPASHRNQWPTSNGITGPHRAEYAPILVCMANLRFTRPKWPSPLPLATRFFPPYR